MINYFTKLSNDDDDYADDLLLSTNGFTIHKLYERIKIKRKKATMKKIEQILNKTEMKEIERNYYYIQKVKFKSNLRPSPTDYNRLGSTEYYISFKDFTNE